MVLKGGKPLHQSVREYIIAKIQDGEYGLGDPIPSERQLSKDLGVSRYTVRQALRSLEDSGYLRRVQGHGTFVSSRRGREGDPGKIGVILTYCSQELISKILAGIEETLSAEGFTMSFADSRNDPRKETELITRFLREGVSGLILMPADDEKGSPVLARLKREGFPFVLVDRKLEDLHVDCVASDNIAGAYQAVEYLIKLGHRRIGFVRDRFSETSSIKERVHGYKQALMDYNLPYDPELVCGYDLRLPQDAKSAILYHFIQRTQVTAICAVHDDMAIDIVKMCRVQNVKIPEDLSVIGFDNLEITEHLEVPLTSVAQFPHLMGAQAAQLLVRKMQSRGKEHAQVIHQIYCPTQLVVRQSCAPVAS